MKLELETERLKLRPFEESDAEAMYSAWASDPEVTKYLTWNAHESVDLTRAVVMQWVSQYEKPERINCAIELKETGELIGGIDVVGYLGGPEGTPVIGYCMTRKYWNRGIMTEACRCLLRYLFSRGYSEVRIDAAVENAGSNRVIQKCGGVLTATEEEFVPAKNRTVLLNRYTVRAPQTNKGADR